MLLIQLHSIAVKQKFSTIFWFRYKHPPWKQQKELAPKTQSQVDLQDFGGKTM